MAVAYIAGTVEHPTQVNLKTEREMVMEYGFPVHRIMIATRDSTWMIKNMAKVFINGQAAQCIKVNLKMI